MWVVGYGARRRECEYDVDMDVVSTHRRALKNGRISLMSTTLGVALISSATYSSAKRGKNEYCTTLM